MLFLQDTTDSYCLKPWEANPYPLRHRYNAGLMMMRKRRYDIEQVEALISFIEDSRGYKENEPYQWYLEQTCWSAIAGKLDARIWNGRQMRVIHEADCYHPELIAGHFVSGVRPLLEKFEKAASKANVEKFPEAMVQSKPAENYTTLNFIKRRVRNKLRRMTGI